MRTTITTVCQDKFSVSAISDGSGVYTFTPTRHVGNKIYKLSQYGRQFTDSKELWDFAYLYGYTKEHYRRAFCSVCGETHSFLKRSCPNFLRF